MLTDFGLTGQGDLERGRLVGGPTALSGADGGAWVVNKRRSSVTFVDAGSTRVTGEPVTAGRG